MADLKDMSLSDEERKTLFGDPGKPVEADGPEYPWGLEVRLDEVTLAKLGLDSLPDVGSGMALVAETKVTGASMREREGRAASKDVTLQITRMNVTKPDSAAKKLFGDSERD